MDMGNLMQIGAQLFQSQLDKDHDGQLEITEIASALMGLMSSGQGQQASAGGLGGLMSMLGGLQGGNSGLASVVSSWIGSGENAPVSGNQITEMFGQDKIAAFAQQLGISQESALSGLQAALPNVVDKATPTGSLDLGGMLDAVGGVQGAIGLASKLFGR